VNDWLKRQPEPVQAAIILAVWLAPFVVVWLIEAHDYLAGAGL
jgi:hypothetical protein